MDNVQTIKGKAKVLATYLKEIGKPVRHAQALDAMARIEGHRDWNVFAAHASRAQVAETSAAESGAAGVAQLFVRTTDEDRQLLTIEAEVTSDDRRARAVFDAAPWFVQASEEELDALAQIEFRGDYAADAVAEFIRDHALSEDVTKVFEYLDAVNEHTRRGESVGFEVHVQWKPAWQYLRAFRYPFFCRQLLVMRFGSLEKAWAEGYGVAPDGDQPGRFSFFIAGEGSDISYDSEDEAWAALGQEFEQLPENEHLDQDIVVVVPGSGSMASPVPGRLAQASSSSRVAGRFCETTGEMLILGDKPLTKKELRDITANGEHLIDIVVSVEFWDLVNHDLEWLNDHVSERITGSEAGLTNIDYEQVSIPEATRRGNVVPLRVRAEVDYLARIDDDDEEDDAGI